MTEEDKYISYSDVHVNLPEGHSGDVTICRAQLDSYNAMVSEFLNPGRTADTNVHTQLWIKGELAMSDTYDEFEDSRAFLNRARGHVLIGGLGLGIVVQALLLKPAVAGITIVELNPDVIKLVGPSVANPNVCIVQGDIATFEPTQKFDLIWIDIWNHLCTSNLTLMKQLRMRYRKWTKSRKVADVLCWGWDLLCREQRREKRNQWYFLQQW